MAKQPREKPGVMLYFADVRPAITRMDDKHLGKLFRAVIDYAELGVVPELDDMGSLAFEMLKPKIDRDGDRYEEKRVHALYMVYCRQMEEAGRGDQKLTEAEWKKTTGGN